MESLVLDLQRAALNSEESVTTLVRKAMALSAKLGLTDLREWCDKELNGYEAGEVPSYREVNGQLKARNPYHGWVPVIIEDRETQESLSKRDIGQPIGELENLLDGDAEGTLQVPLPHDALMKVFGDTEEFQLGMVPTLVVGKNQVAGIVEAVRNKILEWSLELEAKGVVGEGMMFTRDEVSRAASTVYNIGQFSGVIGNVSESSLQFGDYNSLHPHLKAAGISQEERNELERILDDLPQARGEEQDTLMKRGLSWVMRNADKLGSLSDAIRPWFGG